MTGRRDLFINLQHVSLYIIGLPTSTKVVASVGTVCVGQNFIVRNMLYLPELTCNLLSFGQLLDESEYFITLSNDMLWYKTLSRGCQLEWLSRGM